MTEIKSMFDEPESNEDDRQILTQTAMETVKPIRRLLLYYVLATIVLAMFAITGVILDAVIERLLWLRLGIIFLTLSVNLLFVFLFRRAAKRIGKEVETNTPARDDSE